MHGAKGITREEAQPDEGSEQLTPRNRLRVARVPSCWCRLLGASSTMASRHGPPAVAQCE
eukprot:scaffold84269_cov64-Phaeocystis_antarctica.AAC.4